MAKTIDTVEIRNLYCLLISAIEYAVYCHFSSICLGNQNYYIKMSGNQISFG